MSAASIVINEFLPDPSGDETQEEWVELYNLGDSQDVAGWTLCDASNHPLTISTDKTDGMITLLNSGQWLVVYRKGTSFSLNNSGDETISLFNSSSCSGTAIDSVSYNGSSTDKSWGRIPDGTGGLQNDLEKTPAAANQPKPSPIPTPTPSPSSSTSQSTSSKSPTPTPKPSPSNLKLSSATPLNSPEVLAAKDQENGAASPASSPTPSAEGRNPSKVKIASMLVGSGLILIGFSAAFYFWYRRTVNLPEGEKEKSED